MPRSANTLKLCVSYSIISIIETFSEVYASADFRPEQGV
jgi:hypothetical protein